MTNEQGLNSMSAIKKLQQVEKRGEHIQRANVACIEIQLRDYRKR